MKTTIFKITIFSLLIVSCEKFNTSAQYSYQPPVSINDGIDVGSLDEVQMDVKIIEKVVNEIYSGRYSEVHSMLILKDGKLVLEEYFQGHKYQWDAAYHHGEFVKWDRDMLHDIMSATKSITSACIGVAIDQGFIESVHQSIFDYLPEHQHLNTEGKDKITIEHLLTMTSGLAWDEWGAPLSSAKNDLINLWFQERDPISCVLDRSLESEPGTNFTYSGGNMIILGEIIKNSSKMSLEKFSSHYLFEPLGIDSTIWDSKFENGVIYAGGGLKITPRDMAKIGVTYLEKGVWNGKQIIPKHWVEKSAASFAGNQGINIPGEDSGRNGYSYSWWIKSLSDSGKKMHMYSAGGWGGQHIFVLPELNAVVIFTGGNYVTKRPPFKILNKYILPAFMSD